MAENPTILSSIFNTEWSNVNDFEVIITYNGTAPEGQDVAKAMWENLDFYVTSIATPDITQSPIDTFYGDKWALESGRREVQRVTINFRDIVTDDGSFAIYKNIKEWLYVTKDWYTKEKALSIAVKQNGVVVFEGAQSFLESVSNISFNRETASQVGQFSATFKVDPDGERYLLNKKS